MAKALAIPAFGDPYVVEWDRSGPDDGYRELISHINSTIEGLADCYTFQEDFSWLPDEKPFTFQVWAKDNPKTDDIRNEWASSKYAVPVYGQVLVTGLVGIEAVSLDWDVINYYAAEADSMNDGETKLSWLL